jgi:hypothetical protein
MNDFLGMGLIIKDQTAELERLRAEIAHKDRIIKGADVVMNCWRERLKAAGLPLDVDG